MNNRFIVFDTETPNSRNDRMSAIGICVVENNKITDSFYSLVNPETYFNQFNIDLTGITPEAVKDKPNFRELWETVGPLMNSGILVAHSAPFDMSVLAKCFDAYAIDRNKTAQYACTCRMSRKCMPGLENHKLNTLCDALNIELDHHNAMSDCFACAEVLLYCIDCGIDIEKFVKIFDFDSRRTLC